MKKPIYVLGLVYSHDSAAVLLKDGIPLVGIQEERLTRIKHDGSMKDIDLYDCINYCLNAAKIKISDVDLVVENSPLVLYCKDTNILANSYRKRTIDGLRTITISHHLAHAFAAFAASPFKDSAILVVDGQGNYVEDLTENISSSKLFPKNYEQSFSERESIYEINEKGYNTLRKNFGKVHKSFLTIHGLGQMYEYISKYIFNSSFDSGKVMGLAPYGKNKFNFNITKIQHDEIVYSPSWTKHLKSFDKKPFKEDFKYYADVALHIQNELEKNLLFLAKMAKVNSKSKNLCLSGGVALNSVANQKIVAKSEFENIFILPACSDAGIALGCAYYGYIVVLKKKRIISEYTDYLGKKYSSKKIAETLKQYSSISYERVSQPEKLAAHAIYEGKIIGWYQDGSEFGPRALGNRSILCDPRKKNMKEILNSRVKFREPFRPFAPSALEESASKYFNINCPSPYMLLIPKVKVNQRKFLPAITHVDGTARLQTVNKRQNLKYYKLIDEFGKLSGIPVVLNTSFNIRGEPLVETPADAINCFLITDIDELFIGDYRVKKRKIILKDFENKKIFLNNNITITTEQTAKFGTVSKVSLRDHKKIRVFDLSMTQYDLLKRIIANSSIPKHISASELNIIETLVNYQIIRLEK